MPSLDSIKHIAELVAEWAKHPSKSVTVAVALALWGLPHWLDVPPEMKIYWFLIATVATIYLVVTFLRWSSKSIYDWYQELQAPERLRKKFNSVLQQLDGRCHTILDELISQDTLTPRIRCLDATAMGNSLRILRGHGFIDNVIYHQTSYVGPNFSTYTCTFNQAAFTYLKENRSRLTQATTTGTHGVVC